MKKAPMPWGGGLEDLEPLDVGIKGWMPHAAESIYLSRLDYLLQERPTK